jgi:hypothetical protein
LVSSSTRSDRLLSIGASSRRRGMNPSLPLVERGGSRALGYEWA